MEDVVEGVGKKGTSRRSTLGGNRLPPAKPLYDDRIKRSSFFLQSPIVRKVRLPALTQSTSLGQHLRETGFDWFL
eukprot:m.156068 g.156068  ORF g.156068 m.156068 type:complete len:75 (-) comp14426_c0_seq3:163-387(-)